MTKDVYERQLDINLFIQETHIVLSDYICELCKGVYKDPTLDACGHIFCRACLIKFIQKYKTCPVLRNNQLNLTHLQPLVYISNLINAKYVYCFNGCMWTCPLGEVKEHMNKDCPFQKVNCTFTGCNEMIERRYMQAHIEACEFKPDECTQCKASFLQKARNDHLSTCPKIQILCPQNCSISIERENMDKHLRDCENAIVECKFTFFGCDQNRITRKDLLTHMKDENVCVQHMTILAEYSINFSRSTNERLRALENSQNQMIQTQEENNNYLNSKVFNSNLSCRNTQTKTSPPKTLSDVKAQVFKSVKSEKILKDINQAKTIPIKKEKKSKELEMTTCEEIPFIDLGLDDDQEIENETKESKSICAQSQKNEKNLNKKRKRENSKSFERDVSPPNSISLESLDDEEPTQNISINYLLKLDGMKRIILDTINISPGISVVDSKVTCIAPLKNVHKFVLGENIIDSDFEWSVKIKDHSIGWLAIGICLKDIVLANNFKFSDLGDKEHGCFLISSNGYIWNSRNSTQNNKLAKFPSFETGTNIKFNYNKHSEKLIITDLNSKANFSLTNVSGPSLVLCALFLNNKDTIEFLLN